MMSEQELFVFNARELRAARSLTRWIASGCHWAEGADNPVSSAAKAALGDRGAMVQLYRIAVGVADSYESDQITQGIAAEAARLWIGEDV